MGREGEKGQEPLRRRSRRLLIADRALAIESTQSTREGGTDCSVVRAAHTRGTRRGMGGGGKGAWGGEECLAAALVQAPGPKWNHQAGSGCWATRWQRPPVVLCQVTAQPLNREQRTEAGQTKAQNVQLLGEHEIARTVFGQGSWIRRARTSAATRQAAKLTLRTLQSLPSAPRASLWGLSRSHQGTGTWNTSTRGRPVTQPPLVPGHSTRKRPGPSHCRTRPGDLGVPYQLTGPLCSSSCRSGLVLSWLQCPACQVGSQKSMLRPQTSFFVMGLMATTNWTRDASIRGRRVLSPSCNLIVPSQLHLKIKTRASFPSAGRGEGVYKRIRFHSCPGVGSSTIGT